MILVADSGASKTQWFFSRQNSSEPDLILTQGLNPFFIDYADIPNVILPVFNSHRLDTSLIDEVYFYGAGLSSEIKRALTGDALQSLFPYARLSLDTDLTGAARALFGSSSGLAAILGTGANAGIYNGNVIEKSAPSLGFILGDEGSGANIGKKLLQAYLKNQLPDCLHASFYEYVQLSNTQLLDKVYREEFPSRFLGSLCNYLHLNRDNEWVENLINNSFKSFFENSILTLNQDTILPLGFVGSLAHGFSEELSSVAFSFGFHNVKIIQEPGRSLFDFHIAG